MLFHQPLPKRRNNEKKIGGGGVVGWWVGKPNFETTPCLVVYVCIKKTFSSYFSWHFNFEFDSLLDAKIGSQIATFSQLWICLVILLEV